MTDREQLISVLAEVLPYSHGCPEYLLRAKSEMIADHLIANGVVAQECCYKAESVISKTGLMCTACHSDIARDAVFCKYCGSKIMPQPPKEVE